MSQCRYITDNGDQCKRKALPRGKLCWQHNRVVFSVSVITIISAVIAIIGLVADLESLGVTGLWSTAKPEGPSQADFNNWIERGDDAMDIGQYDEAYNYYDQAQKVAKERNDRKGEGLALNGIGGVYWAKGEYGQAITTLDQALVIHREIGNRKSGDGRRNY